MTFPGRHRLLDVVCADDTAILAQFHSPSLLGSWYSTRISTHSSSNVGWKWTLVSVMPPCLLTNKASLPLSNILLSWSNHITSLGLTSIKEESHTMSSPSNLNFNFIPSSSVPSWTIPLLYPPVPCTTLRGNMKAKENLDLEIEKFNNDIRQLAWENTPKIRRILREKVTPKKFWIWFIKKEGKKRMAADQDTTR